MAEQADVVVVGAGPNGLAAAVRLAQAGRSVLLLEANDEVGGAARSMELTQPGFMHDLGAAVLPLGIGSPFFSSLPLHEHGLEWVHPDLPLAHPFDDGSTAVLHREIGATGESFDSAHDARAWHTLMQRFVDEWDELAPEVLGGPHIPRAPLKMARFGFHALRPATQLARQRFEGPKAKGLWAGLAAHSMAPLDWLATSAFALLLGVTGHAVGWPVARGGTGRLCEALASLLRSLGGRIVTGERVESFRQLPEARAYVFDLTPRQLLRIAGEELPAGDRRGLERYRYGQGVFKLDWALSEPIPWTAQACRRAGTVHVGGTLEEMVEAEAAPWGGRTHDRPFVLLTQPTVCDPTRAPQGGHIAWAYCHVPAGCDTDMTGAIEGQIERFAPGFGDCIVARHKMGPADLERHDANLIGGDIGGGAPVWSQLLTRPTVRWTPYATGNPRIFLCSSSTPPGAGVHGMCGANAAEAVLKRT